MSVTSPFILGPSLDTSCEWKIIKESNWQPDGVSKMTHIGINWLTVH